MPAVLKEHYRKTIVPQLMKTYHLKNALAVPRLEKIVVNMGVGEAVEDVKKLDEASADLARITGQKPLVTRAKKSISGFKIRKDMPLGCKVTLRGERMFEFMQRLIHVVLPRLRDFRGVSGRSFDGRGNYSLGIREQTVFPEIVADQIKQTQGMDITFVTTAANDAVARTLLELFGMPFARQETAAQAPVGDKVSGE
ncbi:MAG: 50S ribosomal protein L5 [Candidatus Omnitrophica bacterium]|nr:50S ribosomal protein L5 [Candidatus Omnitrophota bacterium]